MYLSPPDLSEYGIRLPEATQLEANVKDALSVLTKHHHLIDTTKVLDLLPASTKLEDIKEFLGMVVNERTVLRRKRHVMKSLLLSEHLQVSVTGFSHCVSLMFDECIGLILSMM